MTMQSSTHWQGYCGSYDVHIDDRGSYYEMHYSASGYGTGFSLTKGATGPVGTYNSSCYGTPQSAVTTLVVVDITPPTVTSFVIPPTSTSTTVSISTFTATDNIAVTGYLLTESSSTPLVGDSGWTGTAPTTYTFSSAGSKTLYAWAKDAAGNISVSANASVTITLADVIPPDVTFNLPETASSLTVNITTFTATDNVGVVGYNVNETATPPTQGSGDWSVTPPTSYTFGAEGLQTLYAFAIDAAGNPSVVSMDSVTITLPLTWSSSGFSDWNSAVSYCANLAPSGTWRLPTKEELEAAFASRPGDFMTFTTYWSGTEYDVNSAWYAWNITGQPTTFGYQPKVNSSMYHCVQ
jgi:hypothetical protein